MADWALSTIWVMLGDWSMDCFADHINAKATRFNSLFAVPGMEAVDTISQSWQGGISLLVPPFCLIQWCHQ